MTQTSSDNNCEDYNNPEFAEFEEPSREELSDLNKLRNLRVLEFYQALDELYLTGGFEKSGTINRIILSQSEIPDDIYQVLIETLKSTRQELKNGDASLSEIDYQLDEQNSEVAKNLLTAVKKAIRNTTETSDSQSDSFIEKISKIELNSPEDLKQINLGNGEISKQLAELLEKLKAEISPKDFKKISEATQNAFDSGVGGVEDVKNTVVGGARLVYNMGLNNAKLKCKEIQKAVEMDSDFKKRLEAGNEIVKRLNRSEDLGSSGYKLLFKAYFDKTAPRGNMIFLPGKLMKIQTMTPLFNELVKLDNADTIIKIMNGVSNFKGRIKDLQLFIDQLQDDQKTLDLLNKRFGVTLPDQKTALLYRSVLEKILALSVDAAYLVRYVRSVKAVAETGNYQEFMKLLIRFTKLSRDGKWRDVWNSLEMATLIVKPLEDSENIKDLIAPFRGLNETVTGSYEEVFNALQQIIGKHRKGKKIQAKCQFIDQFFTGLSAQNTVLKSLGIEVAEMKKWVESTEYIDALIDVLEAAGTFKNLNRLLEFHGKYTTVDKKPLESMDLIDDFIRYLESSGRWNRKVSLDVDE
ncbi:hypothetical protein CRE_02933 [Caenorhabditis remanei]|uniref:Uncharacterized protein n=1 Tax=Caenorhabditis remanei TaxID=31234 RepID=E3LWR3_CAERE|nr:hypothetical protein CRE_02933 [Caenorhabditis remanei]